MFFRTMDNPKTTNLILLGNTGNGKSSTANSILGKKIFEASDCGESVTDAIEHGQVERKGRLLNVIDMPGLNDTRCQDLAEASTMTLDFMTRGIEFCPDGYDALIFVLKYGNRYTHEEKQVLSLLKAFLGKNWIRENCVIVFTNGDCFYDEYRNKETALQEFCQKQKGDLKRLLDECKSRIVVFDNKNPSESQVDELLEVVDKLSEGGQRYSNAQFKKFAMEREQEIVKQSKDILTQKFQGDFDTISSTFDMFKQMNQAGSQIDFLMKDCDHLKERILEEDKGTGVLKMIYERVCDLGVKLTMFQKEQDLMVEMDSQMQVYDMKVVALKEELGDKQELEKQMVALREEQNERIENKQREFEMMMQSKDCMIAAQLCLIKNKMEEQDRLNQELIEEIIQEKEYFRRQVEKHEEQGDGGCTIS